MIDQRPIRLLLLSTLSVALAGCATLPASFSSTCAEAPRPEITLSEDGRSARTTLDVLTYNIEGLGWPARSGRAPHLEEIGRKLAELRAADAGPDVVIFQEMFSRAASSAVIAADYPALAAGPARAQRRELPHEGAVPGRRKWRKGEIGIHFATGGLAIASAYPIVVERAEPFSKKSCAGLDCLSNKGVLFARIVIPGVPDPVDVFNAHMNSQRASKASLARRDAAHAAQARELASFIQVVGDAAYPAVLGGDFNMRGSDERFGAFRPTPRMTLVHKYCVQSKDACDIRTSWDGDAPWMDTQDLQFFASGSRVQVRPLQVEAMFDGRPDSPLLSDHDGFRVLYELSWPAAAEAAAAASCSAAGPQFKPARGAK